MRLEARKGKARAEVSPPYRRNAERNARRGGSRRVGGPGVGDLRRAFASSLEAGVLQQGKPAVRTRRRMSNLPFERLR